MVTINEKERVVITTTDFVDNFIYVPIAMLNVLRLAMSNEIEETDRDNISVFIDHLLQIMPNRYDFEIKDEVAVLKSKAAFDIEVINAKKTSLTNGTDSTTKKKP